MADFARNNAVAEELQNKKKKMIISGIIICIVLILFLAFMVIHYKNVDAKTFKLFINGNQKENQKECSSDFYITDVQGNIYIKAKELAKLIGWTYQNGEYGEFTEDSNSCYLQNEYEASSIKAGSNVLKKYIIKDENNNSEVQEGVIVFEVKSNDGMVETSKLDLPVISSQGQIYIPFKYINDICNCYGTYDNNKMCIYNQSILMSLALTNAADWGYSNVSGVYENSRALAYGMMVTEKNGLYGVINIFNGESILGFKYKDMLFCQNVKEFLVKTKEGTGNEKVGLVSYDGDVIISPKSYDNISILSDELGLYLVEKNAQYGVLNRDGKIVVHAEYDSIGLSDEQLEEYEYTSEDNKYLIYDNTIVVEADGKYGFYSVNGEKVLDSVYDGLGYSSLLDDTDEEVTNVEVENVLKIDVEVSGNGSSGRVQGIVVKLNNSEGEAGYGVYDAVAKKLIIPCVCSRIYSITKSGEKTYYMEFAGEQLEFKSYIVSQGLFEPSNNS